jgi:hypothetical protein
MTVLRLKQMASRTRARLASGLRRGFMRCPLCRKERAMRDLDICCGECLKSRHG